MKILIIMLTFLLINVECFAQSSSILYNHTNSPIDETNLHSLALDSNQVIWLGSFPNVYKFSKNRWQNIEPNIFADTLGAKFYIRDIQVSENGDIWFSKGYFIAKGLVSLFKFSSGQWTTYNTGNFVLEPNKIFIDKNNKPWFVLTNSWPHQDGFDKIGTLDSDTVKIIDLPWHAADFNDIIKIEDTLLVTVYSDTMGVLKVWDENWEILETKNWRPNHIWKDGNNSILGGKKLCKLKGPDTYYYNTINTFLDTHNANISSFARENQNTFWVGTDNGYLLKIVNENIAFSKELWNNEVSELLIDMNKNKWMILKDVGVYLYNENGIVNIKDKPLVSLTNFRLHQNYPNPFNPITSIEFTVPLNEYVTLKVYDILGKEIAVLVNGNKPTGNYEVKFDGKNLGSGVYFYRLKAGSFSETKKMMLVK